MYTMSAFNVTFQVDMSNETGFTTPEVNGTFNNWCGACAPMTDANSDGIWEITIDLIAGNYEYKYAYDNWMNPELLAPGSSCTVTNFGFTNRSLVVTADVVLPVVCYGACTTCDMVIPARVVTFRVDMNGVTGYSSPQLNGSFNNWCGNCAPMTDDNADGIYELTLTLPQATYEYKFTYDNWAGIEPLTPGSPCTLTTGEFTNRLLELTDDVVLDAVCWGSCTPCGVVIENRDVTFHVDMNGVTGFTTPEVNGTFNSWCGACNPMTDMDGDGIWSTTISIPDGSYEYKFAYDNWAGSELLTAGTPCTITVGEFTNRTLEVSGDTDLGVVCWASCNACDVVAANYNVTFRVDMNGVTGFTTPEVNGTFNEWCGNCNPMSDADGDGIWEVTVNILEGTHEYKYAYDNWAGSETLTAGSSCTITVGEFTNRTMDVTGDTVLDIVCWASCSACGVVVNNYDVTFRVDMNGVTGFTTPEVNGSFNNWCGNCNPMSDTDGDGVWEATLSIPEGSYEYKFAYDNWAGSEQLISGLPCTITNGDFVNRSLTVTGPTDLATVCYASCGPCGGASTYNVIFRVDMSTVVGPFTTPEVNGTFNNWCGGCAPMSDVDGDNVWELIIPLEAGTYEFKYAYDSWASSESLVAGSPCTITTGAFTNRLLTVSSDMDLGVVCWAECGACGSSTGPFNVTFKVNMAQYLGTFTTPEVNGTFNNWCGNCAPMTDVDGDNIWEISIPLAAGSHDYKFSHDNWAGQEALEPGSACTITADGFTNRVVEVSGPTVLNTVCWNECLDCIDYVIENGLNQITVYPVPANQSLTVELNSATQGLSTCTLYSLTGQVVNESRFNGNGVQIIDTSSLADGIYELQMNNSNGSVRRKVLIQH
jgi:1,4-alpha-glucan branching enzyme